VGDDVDVGMDVLGLELADLCRSGFAAAMTGWIP
jgi:hypothetical protein